MDYGWDFMINRHVLAENVVAVVPLDDPAVAASMARRITPKSLNVCSGKCL